MSDGYLVRHYNDYEFCKDIECGFLGQHSKFADQFKCVTTDSGCPKTAREFYNWLSDNGFLTIKKDDEQW